MVSFPTPGDTPAGAPASQPTQQPNDATNGRTPHDTNTNSQDEGIPNSLHPGRGGAPRPPIPQLTPYGTGSGAAADSGDGGGKAAEQVDRVPSILRPGGKSPSLNPFRNKDGSNSGSATGAVTPTDGLARMGLDGSHAGGSGSGSGSSNNPWGAALSAQNTGVGNAKATPTLPADFQQNPWSGQAVELDATSYANPPKPLSVPAAEGQSVWGGESQSTQGTLVRPTDEFSQVFDDHQAWDDLGRAPQIKRSETNKTAESDHDDWNMIDSETSSVAGDAAEPVVVAKPEDGKAEPMANTPSIPPAPAPPVPNLQTAIPNTDTSDVPKLPLPSTPYSDAPTTPWDDPVPNGSLNQTRQQIESQNAVQPIPTVVEPKTEPKHDAPLIEPIGYESPSQSSQSRHEPQTGGLLPERQDEDGPTLPSKREDEERPSLLPRRDEPNERWSSTRQPVDGTAETYQIKKIRWHDPNCNTNPRTSPILVQNENGPCPLVALVNALSLTTPADIPETTLVQVLRSRERVSLNLVLDAVFDELMSPRRTSSEDALPDIGELYEFLQSLHTGMNVNPRFIPTEQMVTAYKRSSLTHLHPTERDALMPGTFENSLEMKLYATFSIPLIHGWLPAKSDPVYAAFERQAVTYEDAQNLLFREEELEAKLSDPAGGLSGPEQQLFQDIMAIKIFMSESATQLTPWGIEVISRAIRPGTFAILFRNDHFSTLYCHPETMQLMTLVTDAGYSSHEEVVWETLADVNGELSEMYSGDYRPVGSPNPGAGPSSSSRQSNADAGGEWTTVQNRRGKDRQQEPVEDLGGSGGVNHEQEDRDLALALQLQEEEEQKEREEQERRRRESRLSEQFIEQQGRQQPRPVARDPRQRTSGSGASLNAPGRPPGSVNIPVTGSGGRRNSDLAPSQPPRPQASSQQVRPLVPPAGAGGGRPAVNRPTEPGEEAPPSYEAAQHDRRYVPGSGQPNPGPAQGIGLGPGMGPGMGPGGIRPSGYGMGSAGYHPNRPPGGRVSQGARDRDRDCVVM